MGLFETYSNKRAREEGVKGLSLEPDKTSKEYKEGLKKLNFEHQLSTGETIYVSENENGEISATVKSNDEIIVDLNKYLPPNVKMVSPSYLFSSPEILTGVPDCKIGRWQYSRAGMLVTVGDMKDMRDILTLLHEIGHSRLAPDIRSIKEFVELQRKNGVQSDEEISSMDERYAYAESIKIAREICSSTGIDLLEGFHDLKDLKESIYRKLIKYRYAAEYKENSVVENILVALFGKNTDSEQAIGLKELFDKRKYTTK